MVVLLCRPENWITAQLMYMISKFTRLSTYKPRSDPHQRTTPSFYLIAKNVDPLYREAKEACKRWKATWR